ncbi:MULTISPECIES: YceD family protein [Mycolicibacterium]|jgi:uncharacterized protein|uniref:Putative metal-binding protein, possibly nucleic-acid binding protein n=1 Tax=Mycolicibacterium tokaiense TaxID=39695 RepID=A0A378TAT9_9MYCO|nr:MULTISPECIES: DUF177 domain-containing protein [Mycolicibacterium]MCV7186267.1 DUF177 domain-containing protein [Mycolicibacterium murale]STZ57277.1 putative metal-binding protein, possibly nucleic-acid binding protein [Mycolicibacterium tokaiense]
MSGAKKAAATTAAAHRQPPSVLTLDIARLGRRPGSMMHVDQTVPSPSRIGLDLIAIQQGAPLHLDLDLQSVSEGVLVTGTVEAPTAGECARCLEPVSGDVAIELTELFAYPDSTTEATTEDDEVGHVIDDTIDLEQSIVDAVGLALPLAPLCSPDCPGLCQTCGVPLATAEPDHHHDVIDPRWAKLTEFLPEGGERTQ